MTLKISNVFNFIVEFFRYLIIGLFLLGTGISLLGGSIYMLYSVQSDLPFQAGSTSLSGGWVGLIFCLALIIGANIVIYKNLKDGNWKESKIHKIGCYILSFGLGTMSTIALLLANDGLFQIETGKILFWSMFGAITLINFIVAYKGTLKSMEIEE